MFYTQKVPQSSMVMLNYLASYSPCHSIQFNDIDLFIGTPNCVLWKYTFKFTYLFNKKNQPSAFSFRTSTTGSEYRVAFLAGKKDLQCRNCKQVRSICKMQNLLMPLQKGHLYWKFYKMTSEYVLRSSFYTSRKLRYKTF